MPKAIHLNELDEKFTLICLMANAVGFTGIGVASNELTHFNKLHVRWEIDRF